MSERRESYFLYCNATQSTPKGFVETSPDNPEARTTFYVVRRGDEFLVRNEETEALETRVEVTPLSAVTRRGQQGELTRTDHPGALTHVSPSALIPIPAPQADKNTVDISVAGFSVRFFHRADQPRIITVSTPASQPR